MKILFRLFFEFQRRVCALSSAIELWKNAIRMKWQRRTYTTFPYPSNDRKQIKIERKIVHFECAASKRTKLETFEIQNADGEEEDVEETEIKHNKPVRRRLIRRPI